jgi:drug/metabolite transporter (DMT)-like permease
MAVKANATAMVLIATTLWGFIGVLIRGLSEAGLDLIQINGLRSIVSAVMLFAILFVYDRSLFRINRRDVWVILFAAAAKLMMDICYVQAQVTLSLSLAAVLLSTDCYFTFFFAYLIFRDDLTVMKIAASVIGFLGCAVLVGLFSGDIGDVDSVGVFIGFGAAVFGALYTVGLKTSMDRGNHPTSVLFYVFLFGSIMILPFMDPVGSFGTVFSGWDTLGILLVLGLFFTLLPYYLYSKGLKALAPSTVNVLLFMETAMAAVAGLLVYGEMLTFADVIGLAMVLLSIFLVDRRFGKAKRMPI